jgi:hypothetical protein
VRTPAPWILAVTIALAAATFAVVDANTDDVSGRTQGTAALIVIGVGIAVMVVAQRAWTKRARRGAALDALRDAREAAATGAAVDAGRLEPGVLFALLAVEPVDERELVAGGDRGWAIAERSQSSAMWMTLLIVVLMVPAIALQKPQLIVLAAIPIVLYAVVLAGRVIRPGGTLDQAYAASDRQLEPLGLHGDERPDLVVVPRVATDGMQAKLVGPTVLRGRRHGRDVEVTIGGSRSETRVAAPSSSYELKGHRQRVRAEGPVPAPVQRVLDELGASPRWTGMKLAAGPDGILVTRRSSGDREWLYDLWLAERLATAA